MPARRSSTVYLWELAWILPSIALPISMLTALAVTALGAGITLVGDHGRIDSTKVAEHPLFKDPGAREHRDLARVIRGAADGADLVVRAQRDPRAGRLDGALLGDQQGPRARSPG